MNPSVHSDEETSMQAAAVAGDPFALDDLVALGVAETAIDACLASRRWIESPGNRAAFADPADREMTLAAIPWSRRRQLHRQFAELGAQRGAPAVETARHWHAAGAADEARATYLAAARHAETHQQHAEAASALRAALDLWPTGHQPAERRETLTRLVRAARLDRDFETAAAAALDLTLDPETSARPDRLAATWRELASIRDLAGRPDLALEARRTARAAFQTAGDESAAATETLAIAETLVVGMKLSEGLADAEQVVETARRLADPALESNALSLAGLALAMRGRAVEARRRIETALEIALRHGLKEAASTAYQRMPYVHSYVGDYHRHRDATLEAIAFCERESLEDGRRACLGCMAWAMLRTGDWKGAAKVCREAVADDPDGPQAMIAKAVTGMLAVFRGELKSARRLLTDSDEAARRSGITPMEFITRAGLALVDELEGDRVAAARRYAELRLFWHQTEDHLDILFGACRAATFAAAENDRPSLDAWTEVAQHVASINGNPESLGTAAFLAGELALLDDRAEEAAAHFLHARECFNLSDLKLDLAHCDHRAGAALLGSPRRGNAIDLLRRSHRAAKALGARPLMAAVTETLASAGHPPGESRRGDSPTRVPRAGLTQRQHEVATHIARGLTNKEIAVELSLSTRTIDMHVGHVLDRLNCRTRAEAVRKLADLGALGGEK